MDNQNTAQNTAPKRFPYGPKIIFVILGAVFLIEVLYALTVLSSPASPPPEAGQAKQVSISLYASKSEFVIKEVAQVTAVLDTGSHETEGTDLLLNFDPKILEATAGAVTKGAIYPEYPQVRIDNKAGSIQISGISGLEGKLFKGEGAFAIINFRAKAKGDAVLTVNFTRGKTDDSNVVEALSGNDILESVTDLTIKVQ